MSAIVVSGTLILNGNLTCSGDIDITSTGLVTPVSDPDTLKTFYSYRTNSYITANGQGRKMASTLGDITISSGGIIYGLGQGFGPDRGPGNNSTLLNIFNRPVPGYGATHAGLGSVKIEPGLIMYITEYITINYLSESMSAELSARPIDPDDVLVTVISGGPQIYGVDFTIDGARIVWKTPLKSLLADGDILRVIYIGDTTPSVPSPRPSYGHWETPVSLGSGGGYYHDPTSYQGSGASGGGAIKLEAPSGTVQVNGTINMDGQEGDQVGGGAGGSVWITAWNITGVGSITAKGGYSRLVNNPDISLLEEGGGGGGGYISLWYRQSNNFSGLLSVAGGINWVIGNVCASDGKIFIKPIQPFLLEKFTGVGSPFRPLEFLNTKWWDSTTDLVAMDNQLTLTSPQDDLIHNPLVTSEFTVSGKNITVSADYIPGGTLSEGYHADFLLYSDAENWVGMSRRYVGLVGESCVNGIISAAIDPVGCPFDFTNVSFQIMKIDSTFAYQYYYSDSTPVTLFSDIIPELNDLPFRVQFSLKKPMVGSVVTEDRRLTSQNVLEKNTVLDGIPSDATSIAMNVIGGSSQYLGVDFYADATDSEILWDGTSPSMIAFANMLASGDILRIQYTGLLPPVNDSTASFDNFAIYEGVVDGAETGESVVYVDSDFGSDSSSGRQLNPLRNLFVATAWAKRGGTVVLYDGTYNPTEVLRKDLTIRGAEGSKPLITSAFVQDSTGSDWENTAVSFFGCQGIVDNVTIAETGTGVRVENGNFDIGRTKISDATTGIKFVKCDPVIARNEISVAGTALDFTSCLNPWIFSNVVYNSSVAVHAVESKFLMVSSNTFDSNGTHVIFDSKSVGIVASNNLTNGSVGLQASTDSSVGSYNNNYYGTPTWYSRTPDATGNDRSDNPQYINGYHLYSTSPDIGNGLLDYDTYLIDFDGASRLDGTMLHSDIGAFEYIDASHPAGDYYVASSGDDFWNSGTIGQPYRTIDKAMLVSDATMHIDNGHYDTYYLSLNQYFDSSNSVNFYIYTSGLQHFVSYHTITATDMVHGYIGLAGFPLNISDQNNFAVNVVGGPVQILGPSDSTIGDYSIEYGNIVWKNHVLEPFLAIGDVLRIVFDGYLQKRALDTLILHNRYSNYEPEKAIFVSPSGSDSTTLGGDGTNTGGNGSFDLPYRTISMALSDSSAGANIVMIAGEYPLFQGISDRILVPATDRTAAIVDDRRVIMDLFDPMDFRAFGTTLYNAVPWTLAYSGNSYATVGGGFLSLTYDGTNTVRADSVFGVVNDFEVQAELRSAIDPLKFMITSADNTMMFSYTDTTYVASIITGGKAYNCSGIIDGVCEPRLITEYITVTANDLRNQYVSLSHVPEPDETCANYALNVIGGTAQEYNEDFYVQDSKIKWDGMAQDNMPELDPGEVLRVIYLDRSMVPVKIYMSLIGNRFTIKAYSNGTWYVLNKRDMIGTYVGPWTVSFVMNQPANSNHDFIFGKGYVSQFLAIGSSFTDTDIDQPLTRNTERKNVVLYKDRF